MYRLKFFVLVLSLTFIALACEREYTPPPLSEPRYEGQRENITIDGLKVKYDALIDPELITEDLVLRAIVVGNDESGNIYKQIYIQDASGGINIGVDQNSMYTIFQVGQEVFVQLKGLYMVKYGGELQIGMGATNANRISWEMFQLHAFANSWPKVENAQAREVRLDELKADMVNTLVQINDIRFVNGGKNAFTTGDKITNEQVKSADGKVLDVRSSNYATFAKDMLPKGKGTVVGMLGRFNGGWQLFLRTIDDVKHFDGTDEDKEVAAGSFFKETFGEEYYPSGNRPKINDFKDFDMKAPITYADETGIADIRSMAGGNGAHIWLPASKESLIKISGINTRGKGDVVLSFELAANLYDAGTEANLNDIQLRINGVLKTLPNQKLTNANGDNGKFHKINIADIPQEEVLVLEFVSSAEKNKVGFRLDNIELVGGDGAEDGGEIVVTPEK